MTFRSVFFLFLTFVLSPFVHASGSHSVDIPVGDELFVDSAEKEDLPHSASGHSKISGQAGGTVQSSSYTHKPSPAILQLVFQDGEITPNLLEVEAGKPFSIEVVNAGKMAVEFESKSLRKEKILAPGAKATIKFRPLRAGKYEFFDDFHRSHPKSKGILLVK